MEQYIRTRRAAELGLVAMLDDDGKRDPQRMVTALRQLPQQALPSSVVIPGLLDGLENVNRLVELELDPRRSRRLALARSG
jgi:predicted glycosyltransferase